MVSLVDENDKVSNWIIDPQVDQDNARLDRKTDRESSLQSPR